MPEFCRRLLTPIVICITLLAALAVQYYTIFEHDEYSREVEQLHSIGMNASSSIAIRDAHFKPLSIFYKIKALPSQRMLYTPPGDDRAAVLPGASHILSCSELHDFDFVITALEKCLDEERFERIGTYFGAGLYKRRPAAMRTESSGSLQGDLSP